MTPFLTSSGRQTIAVVALFQLPSIHQTEIAVVSGRAIEPENAHENPRAGVRRFQTLFQLNQHALPGRQSATIFFV